MIKIRSATPLALLAITTAFVLIPCGTSADEPKQLVATSMQDEKEQIPQENLAWYSSTKREKRVRIALREQREAQTDQLANLKVTIVNHDLETREYDVDESGFATIDNVQPGAQAMVVTGDSIHAATVVYFKEQPDEADTSIEKPVELSPMKIPNAQLLSLVDNYLGSGTKRAVDEGAYDADIQATFNQSQPFEFQVRLSDKGTLAGQVITVMRKGTQESEVADTNIVLLKDGKPIARAVTDASGQFFFEDVRPGVHGLIAAGRGGYAAFAFEAIGSEGFVLNQRNAEGHQFVANMIAVADVCPVVLIPAPMVNTVIEIIEEEYVEGVEEVNVQRLDDFGGIPTSGGVPTGLGAAPGTASTGVGGTGGVGGLAAGFFGAAVAASTSGDSLPGAISPSVPQSQIQQQ